MRYPASSEQTDNVTTEAVRFRAIIARQAKDTPISMPTHSAKLGATVLLDAHTTLFLVCSAHLRTYVVVRVETVE